MAVTSTNSTTSAVSIRSSGLRAVVSVTNTDANDCYVLCDSGTPSASNHTAVVPTGGLYETPVPYAGEIRAVWAGDGSGAAIVTEFER